ncbi:MAG: 4-(cytidine 5'-diphospho)-2-C-methyl-D-erythritol kinase [Oscillospiraceae bacterium]|jgi:4-diphosphocytidyl-2-C-methyl-D-erythritol kinase|nr:4-(cytidine 5'-diphospho)-2-C-methyl-D-erythritol kinase [Oscillospiraceae bacterium]
MPRKKWKITLPAYAKLNLYLDVTGKRADGYHEIESVMRAIDLHDVVTVTVTENGGDGNITVKCDDPSIPVGAENIAYRAAALFMEKSGLSFKAEIDIRKRIPVMAGLGGSSTDGAAVLTALNRIYNAFDAAGLSETGAALGADVPFCLTGGTALCKGAGGVITPLPSAARNFYVIIKPDFGISTKRAYEMYDRLAPVSGPVSRDMPYNAFQALYKDGRIDGICRDLINSGALGASMTGSGSAVFGVFAERAAAENACKKLDYPHKFIACDARRALRGVNERKGYAV